MPKNISAPFKINNINSVNSDNQPLLNVPNNINDVLNNIKKSIESPTERRATTLPAFNVLSETTLPFGCGVSHPPETVDLDSTSNATTIFPSLFTPQATSKEKYEKYEKLKATFSHKHKQFINETQAIIIHYLETIIEEANGKSFQEIYQIQAEHRPNSQFHQYQTELEKLKSIQFKKISNLRETLQSINEKYSAFKKSQPAQFNEGSFNYADISQALGSYKYKNVVHTLINKLPPELQRQVSSAEIGLICNTIFDKNIKCPENLNTEIDHDLDLNLWSQEQKNYLATIFSSYNSLEFNADSFFNLLNMDTFSSVAAKILDTTPDNVKPDLTITNYLRQVWKRSSSLHRFPRIYFTDLRLLGNSKKISFIQIEENVLFDGHEEYLKPMETQAAQLARYQEYLACYLLYMCEKITHITLNNENYDSMPAGLFSSAKFPKLPELTHLSLKDIELNEADINNFLKNTPKLTSISIEPSSPSQQKLLEAYDLAKLKASGIPA